MRLNLTAQDLISATGLTEKAVAKLFSSVDFEPSDFSHAEIQYCLDNDIEFTSANLYSPVVTMAQMEALEVPAAWPGSEKFDEEGESLGQKNFEEYGQYHAVDGGYCIKFAGGPKDENNNIRQPTFQQVKVWVNKTNGFKTEAEFQAIRVVEEPE